MGLIYFQGLNCYSSSIINAAIFNGVDYRSAFSNLWSETYFTYDQVHHIFLSTRMSANLEELGIRQKFLNCCSVEAVKRNLSQLSIEQWLVVGMDAFYIPWTPFFNILHSYHYFIAQKRKSTTFFCYDPTYDIKDLTLNEEYMISHITDICQINKYPGKQLHRSVLQETREILYSHPITRDKLISQIEECTCDNRKRGELLAKYIDALINNRYLYVHYLNNLSACSSKYNLYFSEDFFHRWLTVKYGLFKSSLRQNNQDIINEICECIVTLFYEEMNAATKIGDKEYEEILR